MTRHGHRGIDHDHGPNFLKPQWEPWGGEGVVFASSTTARLWHEHRTVGLRRLKRMSTMLRLGSQSNGDQICKWCSILGWMSWTYLGISETHISFMDSYIHVILCSRKYIYTTVPIQIHTHIQSIHSHNAEPYYF